MSGKCSQCRSGCVFRESKAELFGHPCDGCKLVWCKNCSGVSSTEIRTIVLSSRVLPFFCKNCIAAIREVPQLKAQIAGLQADIKELKECAQTSKQSYADVMKIRSDSDTLRGSLDVLVKKVEVISSGDEPASVRGVTATIEPTIEEMRERERRSANVLIFGVAEPSETEKNKRVEHDKSRVQEILGKVGEDVQVAELKIHRIGKFNKDKRRPIKVGFPSIGMALGVLRRKQRAEDDSGAYIKADLTLLQRQHLKTLLNELEARTKDGNEKLRLRYVNSVPRIVPVREHVPKN